MTAVAAGSDAITAVTVELRPATPEDAAFIAELSRGVKRAELAAGGLDGSVLEQLLDLQQRAQELHVTHTHPVIEEQLVVADGITVGRLQLAPRERTLHVIDLAIQADHRGRGIGSAVVAAVQQRAQREGLPVSLDVVKTNPALRLYQRLGFGDPVDRGLHWGLAWTPTHPPRRTP